MRSICPKCSYLLICEARHKDSVVECGDFKSKISTNADCIRQMSDEELAEWIKAIVGHCANGFCGKGCPLYSLCYSQGITELDWLKQEVTTNSTT